MADFYFDEDVGQSLSAQLQRFGHRVVQTVASGRSGATDANQLAYAAQHRLILVTHNMKDFRSLHLVWQEWRQSGLPTHHGILAIPQPRSGFNTRYNYSYAVAAQLIDGLVNTTVSIHDQFVHWHPIDGWVS